MQWTTGTILVLLIVNLAPTESKSNEDDGDWETMDEGNSEEEPRSADDGSEERSADQDNTPGSHGLGDRKAVNSVKSCLSRDGTLSCVTCPRETVIALAGWMKRIRVKEEDLAFSCGDLRLEGCRPKKCGSSQYSHTTPIGPNGCPKRKARCFDTFCCALFEVPWWVEKPRPSPRPRPRPPSSE